MCYYVCNVYMNLKQLITDQTDRCRCESGPQRSSPGSSFMLISISVLHSEMQASTCTIAMKDRSDYYFLYELVYLCTFTFTCSLSSNKINVQYSSSSSSLFYVLLPFILTLKFETNDHRSDQRYYLIAAGELS